jgi:hypothetical protein
MYNASYDVNYTSAEDALLIRLFASVALLKQRGENDPLENSKGGCGGCGGDGPGLMARLDLFVKFDRMVCWFVGASDFSKTPLGRLKL